MGCYHPGKRIFKVYVKQSQSFEIDKVLSTGLLYLVTTFAFTKSPPV